MASRDSLTILEVIENLNTLVEADSLDELEVTEEGSFISRKVGTPPEGAYFVQAGVNEETIGAIRETFRQVHKYLVTFYRKMKESGDSRKLIDGINTIMVLVGEAEKKLEKFDTIFKERLPKLEEYKNLQHFYHNHLIKETFKEFSKKEVPHIFPKGEGKTEEKWEEELGELLEETSVEEVGGVHLLNDIETVKGDHLYELFYIKNEAGHNFYTSDLARNIKLACDFGEFAKQYFGDDPLLQIKNWEDKSLHLLAKKVLTKCKKDIDSFCKQALKYRDVEIVSGLLKAITALMLAANPRTLIRNFSIKGSHLYMRDFQLFLRDVLTHRDYQRFLIYSPPSSTPFFAECLHLIHSLAYHTITGGPDLTEVQRALREMRKKNSKKEDKKLSDFLRASDENLRLVLTQHPSGPLFKALDLVREEEERKFDPFMLGNLPTIEGALILDGEEIPLYRSPSPTIQEYIDESTIAEEFKAYLHAGSARENFHLLCFNTQDRTSWKEHARCRAIEELGTLSEFSSVLSVVTLAKETEFYNEQGIYHDLSHASDFKEQFYEHLHDENTGYFFPPQFRKELFPDFCKDLLQRVHDVFFDGKKTLKLSDRLIFIEIVYHFIELKLIEIKSPTEVLFMSKDGLDDGGTSIVALLALLALGQKRKWREEEYESIVRTLYGVAMLYRERAIHPERFERVHDMIKLLEEKEDYLKQFVDLFNKTTLQMEPRFYKENGVG